MKTRIFIIIFLFFFQILKMSAQENVAKSGLSELANGSSLTRGLAPSILYMGGAVLALGLIGLVYALASRKPNAKEYLISWILAVLFYMLLLVF